MDFQAILERICRSMELSGAVQHSLLGRNISEAFGKMLHSPLYKGAVFLLGAPVHLYAGIVHLGRKRNHPFFAVEQETRRELLEAGTRDQLFAEFKEQLQLKEQFFQRTTDEEVLAKEAAQLADERIEALVRELAAQRMEEQGEEKPTYAATFQSLLTRPLFCILSFLPGLLMYGLLFMYSNPYLKYMLERLFMTLFVIFGVSVLVFTILYLSPFNPAANILGVTATPEQIANFNAVYGLDQPYWVQLWNYLRGIALFDLGKSFAGNEEIASAIARKFPVTLVLSVLSLVLAVVIALPIGILSATRPNTLLDYSFMLIALIGLSIPNFWQGLIFILNFSIKLQWLPPTYNPQNWLSMIMPVAVLGTGLTAAVARMTRSSTLEVIHEDYMLTAKAKGLTERQVIWRHGVRNAIIPIITVIGLQFGAMMGGAAVTEKVFNISGLGSYIVDKQFIPDIPGIMGGVVYIAITISIINAIIDISYAFFDPRIRSRMKQY